MRIWPVFRCTPFPRPNVRLADLPVLTPRRLRLAVDWLLRSQVLWRVK